MGSFEAYMELPNRQQFRSHLGSRYIENNRDVVLFMDFGFGQLQLELHLLQSSVWADSISALESSACIGQLLRCSVRSASSAIFFVFRQLFSPQTMTKSAQ